MKQKSGKSFNPFIRVRFSIMLKLVLIFLPVILAPMTIMVSLSVWITANRMESDFRACSRTALNNAKNILSEYEKRAENIAELLAETEWIREKLPLQKTGSDMQEELKAKQDMWFTAIVEVFDIKKQLVARTYTDENLAKAFFTNPEAPLVAETLGMKKASDYFVLKDGLALKASWPIVNYKTLEPVGAVIVTYPLNILFLRTIKEWIQSEVTVIFESESDGKLMRVFTTLQDQKAYPLERLWETAVSDFRAVTERDIQKRERIIFFYRFYIILYKNI